MQHSTIAPLPDKQKIPEWLPHARAHATEYLHRFANNPGVERVVKEFDPTYLRIKDPNKRLDHLAKLAAKHWDFRKGRERFEITETFDMDDPDSELGTIIHEGARQAEMASPSTATLKHYSMLAILGGANKSPYNRLRYALEQKITYDMLVYLGSERELLPAEQAQVQDYAPGARTEFDLGKGAIISLLGDQLANGVGYDIVTSEWHIERLQRKDGLPIFLLSAPPFLGGTRANTADTYDFLRRLQQESFTPSKNILFATSAIYRYAQYFDAVREISLRTGVDIETLGFEPTYAGMEFKPSQFLQELKSAADAAVRLRDVVQGKDETNRWRNQRYNRFQRED